jgi:hypothetical protein
MLPSMRAVMSGKVVLAAAWALALAGCGDETEARLKKALGDQGVKDVKVTEEMVIATCSSGATVEIPAEELERNFLGMAKANKVTVVGRKILQDCDTKDKERARDAQAKAMIADEVKRLGIDTTGLQEAAVKLAICEKLTERLPQKDPERTVEGLQNTQRWGCEPPPPPSAPPPPPAGTWLVELGKPEGKKPATSFLRQQNDGGERLTVRCSGKKVELYVQPDKPVKKGTKAVTVKVGAAKPAKWKANPSTDGKALFFPDTKVAFKAMADADELTFFIPGAKKVSPSTFAVKNFSDALQKLPKACR